MIKLWRPKFSYLGKPNFVLFQPYQTTLLCKLAISQLWLALSKLFSKEIASQQFVVLIISNVIKITIDV